MRYPDTLWDPVADRSRTVIKPDVYIVHVAVTSSPDIYGPGKGPAQSYAHFYVPETGKARQHQETDRRSLASGGANFRAISVETEGWGNAPFNRHQIDLHAYLFACAVYYDHVPNRIATPGNVTGLAWHRLGCRGHFGKFNRHDRTTWSSAQTGEVWSNSFGKICPGDHAIRQIDDIYNGAQTYLKALREPRETIKETIAEIIPELEKDVEKMKMLGLYWKNKDGKVTYALTHPLSGYWAAHSGVTGSYNNSLRWFL